MKTVDEVRECFLEAFPTITEQVAGVGPFTWYLIGFRAAEKLATEETAQAKRLIESIGG
jgi:hypothetical protein